MTMHLGKKIVCVKDIPSNIIEEAIFILKSNVAQDKDTKYAEKRTKEIILNEAEEVANEYAKKISKENELEMEMNEENSKRLKKELIYIGGLIIIVLVCISIVI